jgi:hypothetical protein
MWWHQCRHRQTRVKRSVLALQISQSPVIDASKRALSEADAVDIWIARWLRIRRKDLVARYGCDSRRLYEIWWGERFPKSRDKARELFEARYPGLLDQTQFGYRRIPRKTAAGDEQMSLFG